MTEPSETVLEQYEEVRQSGAVNMINMNGVQGVANSMGHNELVTFIEEHGRDGYSKILESY